MADVIDRVFENTGAKTMGQEQAEEPVKEEQPTQDQTSLEENKTTEPEDQTQKTNADGQEKEGTTETQEPEKKEGEEQKSITGDDVLRFLNEQYEAKFESLDEVKGLTSSKQKLSEYEAKIQEKEEALRAVGDPYSNFANEQIAKTNEILKKNENLPFNVASKLASANIDEMKDDEVLVMQRRIDGDIGSDSDLLEDIQMDYELDVDEDDMDDKTKKRLERNNRKKQRDANKARQSLKQMSNVETPQAKDVEAEYKQKIENYKPKADKLIDESVDKLTINVDKDEYEHKIDDSFKDFLKKDGQFVRFLVNNQYDLSDESQVKKAVNQVKQIYFNQNRDKIIKDVVEQERARMQDQVHKERHNPKDGNRQEKPEMTDREQRNIAESNRLIQSVTGRKKK